MCLTSSPIGCKLWLCCLSGCACGGRGVGVLVPTTRLRTVSLACTRISPGCLTRVQLPDTDTEHCHSGNGGSQEGAGRGHQNGRWGDVFTLSVLRGLRYTDERTMICCFLVPNSTFYLYGNDRYSLLIPSHQFIHIYCY